VRVCGPVLYRALPTRRFKTYGALALGRTNSRVSDTRRHGGPTLAPFEARAVPGAGRFDGCISLFGSSNHLHAEVFGDSILAPRLMSAHE
jgi:hypothetical protein